MTGPNARTTQLFINLADNSRLDAQGFSPIGEVIEGMEVVDKLYAGYGESAGGGMRGGAQGAIFEGGNKYLDREFPLLDKLIRASVVKRQPAEARSKFNRHRTALKLSRHLSKNVTRSLT